ncbi:MAG: phosphatidylserine/phosphatidylglycerophosphate/cardiolipin synthase family protein, partial [Bdellovibrionales bacterium]|nr:phosphatidylserine/phosphatidylglycerophosphate/cardiolipin synthase family protein [Bdellovibrionales bacterium]
LTSLAACQSGRVRDPNASFDTRTWEELRVLRQRTVELNALSIHFQKKKNEEQLNKIQSERAEIAKKIATLESNTASFSNQEKRFIENKDGEWREEREKLDLQDLSLYALPNSVSIPVSTFQAKETELHLTHTFFSSQGLTKDRESGKMQMDVTMKCDAPFEAKYGLKKKVAANTVYKFSIADKKLDIDYHDFFFHPNMKTCEFKFTSNSDTNKTQYGFKLYNETEKLNVLSNLVDTTDVCALAKGTDKFYESTEFPNMTCPKKYESIEILPEPEDSIHARAKALLGQDLPAGFIDNANPYAELDFSKAPKLDAILVSYLVFRSDFYGTLMGRLLAFHADRGALVRVIMSQVITLDKDKAMYEKLMAKHPNMKFVRYQFDKDQQNGSWIDEFHRTNHVKLFVGYSKSNPKDSFLIVGGRNIHDGFAFKIPPRVEKFPEIVNYVSGDESWAYWRDFEMVIKGQDFIESVVRNYMNFYHMNKDNMVVKLSSVAIQKDDADVAQEKTMRHYVSIPFKDEPHLNLFYARMIDSAKKKILISSPYFRPVKEIADALDRAIERGVDITIITRLDLEGDTADFILGAVNKDGVNHFLKKIKVYEYIEPKVILHSKLLMVDEEVSFISSVNLNKRSFYHDMENGVVVNDPRFTVKMGDLYATYLKMSKQLTEIQKIEFWKRWIIKAADKYL